MASLEDYAKQIKGKICRWCETPLVPVVKFYDHHGGYAVDGFESKQWLYTNCPKCGYQTALWKLEIKEIK